MAKPKTKFDHGKFGKKHNSLFCPGPNMRLNACVGKNGGPAGFDRYARGYFEAGMRLVASLQEDSLSVDSLIYPLVMVYRHGIETALKHLVRVLPPICDSDADFKLTHKLLDNWAIVRRFLADLDAEKADLDQVGAFLKDFAKIDPRGETFRYPEDREGNLLLQESSIINVEVFGEGMAFVAQYLEWSCYLADQLLEAKAEQWQMEQEALAEMRDYYGQEDR